MDLDKLPADVRGEFLSCLKKFAGELQDSEVRRLANMEDVSGLVARLKELDAIRPPDKVCLDNFLAGHVLGYIDGIEYIWRKH